MRQLTVDGLGWATIPDLVLHDELQRGALVRVMAPWIRRRVEVFALTTSRRVSPAVRAVLEALRAAVAR